MKARLASAAELKDQPEVQAELALVMGKSYTSLEQTIKPRSWRRWLWQSDRRQVGQESTATADALTLLGAIKMRQGDLVNAEKLTREGLEINRKLRGPESTQVAEDINNIATININKGDLKKAEEGLRESLAIYRKALGNKMSLMMLRRY